MPYLGQSQGQPSEAHSGQAGTVIETEFGTKSIETLEIGDLIQTKDNGLMPLRWIGVRTLSAAALKADPALRPIRIKAGALGSNRPATDLVVSPEHCVLLDDWRCALLFGEEEMLAPAHTLVNDQTIHVDYTATNITYHHLVFDRHEIIGSNGVDTESYDPKQPG